MAGTSSHSTVNGPEHERLRSAPAGGGLLGFLRDFHNKTILFRVGDWIFVTYGLIAGIAFFFGFSKIKPRLFQLRLAVGEVLNSFEVDIKTLTQSL